MQDVLLEVNIGGEESKSGVSPEQLCPCWTLPPQKSTSGSRVRWPSRPSTTTTPRTAGISPQVYKLFVQAGERGYENVKMETLSMGMSGDFENAIREGATLVRIGTAIYGERLFEEVTSQSGLRPPAPLVGEPLAYPASFTRLPKPPLVREVARRRRDGEV